MHKSDTIEMTLKAPRVLIVEDEAHLRDLLLDVVPDMGFPATAVRSAEEAIRILQAGACDIMILDLQLPGMNGMELFERIRKDWPLTEVIVLTGFGDLPTAQRSIHLDVVDFLSKPCHLSDLEYSLDRARRRTRIAPHLSTLKQSSENSSTMTLSEIEYREIMAALSRTNGNKRAAARELGISRRSLHYRLAEYRRRGRANF